MVLEIDGSILEGGGQILRICIALSVLRQIPIRVFNIRANRPKPGLSHQHLTGIRLVREISQGELENDAVGSSEVTFAPCTVNAGSFRADTKTGGSVALLLQVSLPCCFFGRGPIELNLKGGTNVDMAPSVDYIITVLKPLLERFGAKFDVEIVKRGFFTGNGCIQVTVDPVKKLTPINLVDFGDIESIWGEAFVAGVLPPKMAREMADAAETMLRKFIQPDCSISSVKYNNTQAFGNGSGINLFVKTTTGCVLGSCSVGRRGDSMREIGATAAETLIDTVYQKACVDEKMQDQVIIFMALADGKSRIKTGPITPHTKTAIVIAERMLKTKFKITQKHDETCYIECDGIGYTNENTLPSEQ